MNQDTFGFDNKTDEEIEEEYKKALFLNALRDGKLPQRRNLIKNIFYLSGLYHHYRLSDTKASTIPKYSKCATVWLRDQSNARTITNSPNFIFRVKRYFNNQFKINIPYVFSASAKFEIHYNKEDIKWALVDYDLAKEHPNNTEKRANNFIYVLNYHEKRGTPIHNRNRY